MGRDKHELLDELKRRKSSWQPSDAQELLESFGFRARKGKRGHVVWTKGRTTLTVPEPHGRERLLLPCYASQIVRKIEEAEASADERDASYEARDDEDA